MRRPLALLIGILPLLAYTPITVDVGGGRTDVKTAFARIVNFLMYASGAVCTTLFVIGALLLVISRGQDPLLSQGKDLIWGSLIGLVIILGARGILRMVAYIFFG